MDELRKDIKKRKIDFEIKKVKIVTSLATTNLKYILFISINK